MTYQVQLVRYFRRRIEADDENYCFALINSEHCHYDLFACDIDQSYMAWRESEPNRRVNVEC